MRRYKAIIIDDNHDDIIHLTKEVKHTYPMLDLVAACSNADEGKTAIQNLHPQLLFLDVELGSRNGLEMLRGLTDETVKVIFFAQKPDWTIDAIRMSAIDYLLKPYKEAELHNAINRAINSLNNNRLPELTDTINRVLQNIPVQNMKPQALVLSNKDGQHMVLLSDIMFCCTVKATTTDKNIGVRILFRLVNGENVIVSNTSLNYFEEILASHAFARVANSYIVNMRFIKTYQKKGGVITMRPFYDAVRKKSIEEEIYVSDSKKEAFNMLYRSYAINIA